VAHAWAQTCARKLRCLAMAESCRRQCETDGAAAGTLASGGETRRREGRMQCFVPAGGAPCAIDGHGTGGRLAGEPQ